MVAPFLNHERFTGNRALLAVFSDSSRRQVESSGMLFLEHALSTRNRARSY